MKYIDKPLPHYSFEIFSRFSMSENSDFKHSIFTRFGGVSTPPYDELNVRYTIGDDDLSVSKNRQKILDFFNVDEFHFISANQSHSGNVVHVNSELLSTQRNLSSEVEIQDTDAFITDTPGILCMIQVADCQAQILYDPEHRAFGIVHAGWKGLVKDISGNTIYCMKKKFGTDPSKLLVGIAPSLGPCCSYFSNPHEELPQNFHPYIDSELRVHLWDFAKDQLQSHGVLESHIEVAQTCTKCNGAEFFSYRRDGGKTGRFAVAAMFR